MEKVGEKTILIIRPHFVSVKDILEISEKIKNQFPSAKIILTGNRKHLDENEIATLKSNREISELILFDEKTSKFKYFLALRKFFFHLVIFFKGNPVTETKSLFLTFFLKKKEILTYEFNPKINDYISHPVTFSQRFKILPFLIEGFKIFFRIFKKKGNPYYLLNKGIFYFCQGDTERAAKSLLQLIEEKKKIDYQMYFDLRLMYKKFLKVESADFWVREFIKEFEKVEKKVKNV